MESNKFDKPFFSVADLALYSGLSKSCIYNYASSRLIPSYRVRAGKLYFKKEDIDSFFLNNKFRRKSQEELIKDSETHFPQHKGGTE